MTDIPEWVMKAAREAYILVLPPASQWIAEDVRDGFADTSSEIQTAARAIMAERERCAKVADDEARELERLATEAREIKDYRTAGNLDEGSFTARLIRKSILEDGKPWLRYRKT